MQSRFAFGTRLHRVSKIIVIFDQGAFLVPNANAFVCFHMKAFLFYHTQFCLSRTFLTFFEVFQPRIQFLKPFQNFSSRFAVLLNSLFSISQEEPLVNNFFSFVRRFSFVTAAPHETAWLVYNIQNQMSTTFSQIFYFLFPDSIWL